MITRQSAFTLFEIMVVIALIGVMAAFIMPRAFRRTPQTEWETVLADINNLVFAARQEALSNQKVYRLVFTVNPGGKNAIDVEEEVRDPEKPELKIYRSPQYADYFSPHYDFDDSIKIKDFYAGKKRILSEERGSAPCYVVPEGLVEDVTLHLIRRSTGQEEDATFSMMPFYGTFSFVPGFKRPE